jgi:5-methylcytosine-specific restriction endonuclease McrA
MMSEEFVAAYPTTSNSELAAAFGVTVATIKKWAGRLGVKKDARYRAAMQRQNASGRVLSVESRAKIAARARGRALSAETKAKILKTKRGNCTTRKGEQHYKWKGGRPWERFKDPLYVAWRTAVLERDGYSCQWCHRRCKKYEKGLAAHHIKPYAAHPELRYEVANGMTLCRQCHLSLHGKAPKLRERVPCACGCDTMIDPVDRYGRRRRFVNHHGSRGRKLTDATKQLLREQRQGQALTPEHRVKIAAGLRNSTKTIGRPRTTR